MQDKPITGPQCAAARALAQIGLEVLARRTGLDPELIRQFEDGWEPTDLSNLNAIKTALEGYGVHFIPEDDMGVGVRLRFTESVSRKVSSWEGEGGAVGSDNVP